MLEFIKRFVLNDITIQVETQLWLILLGYVSWNLEGSLFFHFLYTDFSIEEHEIVVENFEPKTSELWKEAMVEHFRKGAGSGRTSFYQRYGFAILVDTATTILEKQDTEIHFA